MMTAKKPDDGPTNYQRGYILEWRGIQQQQWYSDPVAIILVEHLLKSVTHKPYSITHNNAALELQPGQLLASQAELATDSAIFNLYKNLVKAKDPKGAAKKAVHDKLQQLQQDGFLSFRVLGAGKHRKTLVTLCNWRQYQDLSIREAKTVSNGVPNGVSNVTPIREGLEAVEKTNDVSNGVSHNNTQDQQRSGSDDPCSRQTPQTASEVKHVPKGTAKQMIDVFKEEFAGYNVAMPLDKIRPMLARSLVARYKDSFENDIDTWRGYLQYIKANLNWMLTGINKDGSPRGRKNDLAFFIQPRIIEGVSNGKWINNP